MTEKRKRRWFRFGLRTLFVLVTLVALWVGWSMHWIRQRRELLAADDSDPTRQFAWSTKNSVTAPGLLWIFGEKGIELIIIPATYDSARAQRLFPEAEILEFVE